MSDLSKQLRSIRSGAITDPDRVRSILSEARMAIAARRKKIDRMEELYFDAEKAFLHGWAPHDERTEI